MNREDLFACFDKASEVFAQRTTNQMNAADEEEEDELEARMQEEELARLVAEQMGIKLEAFEEEAAQPEE